MFSRCEASISTVEDCFTSPRLYETSTRVTTGKRETSESSSDTIWDARSSDALVQDVWRLPS